MDNFNKVLEDFGKSLGELKRAYAEEFRTTVDDLMVIVDNDNYVSILPNNTTGVYVEYFRGWVDVDTK